MLAFLAFLPSVFPLCLLLWFLKGRLQQLLPTFITNKRKLIGKLVPRLIEDVFVGGWED